MIDYYQILEVPLTASDVEIQRAYRQLIQIWHPDRFQGNLGLLKRVEEKAKQINEAFRHLSDPDLRKQHDNHLRQRYSDLRQPGQSNPDPFSAQEFREMKVMGCPNPKCGVGLRVPAKGRLKVNCPRCSTHFMYDGSLDATWNLYTPDDKSVERPKKSEDSHWGYRLGKYLGRTYVAKMPVGIKSVLCKPWVWIATSLLLVAILNLDRLLLNTLPTSTTSQALSSSADGIIPDKSGEQRPPLRNTAPQAIPRIPESVSSPAATLPVVISTGTRIGSYRVPKGRGSLRVINGTSSDAILKIGEAGGKRKLLATLYLRANEEITLKSVGTGNFRLAFALGSEWSQQAKRFKHVIHYKMFDEPVLYAETKDIRKIETEDGIETQTRISAAEWTFTLHMVPSGNAITASLDEDRFDSLFVDID